MAQVKLKFKAGGKLSKHPPGRDDLNDGDIFECNHHAADLCLNQYPSNFEKVDAEGKSLAPAPETKVAAPPPKDKTEDHQPRPKRPQGRVRRRY